MLEAERERVRSELVHYFGEHADRSVVALLPEEERALDDSYRRIDDG